MLATVSAWAQTSIPENAAGSCFASGVAHGLVVERVDKDSEGLKAGLMEGDVILSWTRGEMNGDMGSPFDLSEIETEQEPRGQVTLVGTRRGREQKWVLGPDDWRIHARPTLPAALLASYTTGQQLAGAGKLSDATNSWRAAADESQKYQCSWLAPWFLFHAADAFGDAGKWGDSGDLYQESLSRAPGIGTQVRLQILKALAGARKNQTDLANAVKFAQQAQAEFQTPETPNLTLASIVTLAGNIEEDRGELQNAKDDFSRALTIRENLAPDSFAVSWSLRSRGNVEEVLRDLDSAEKDLQRALEIAERLAPGGRDDAGDLIGLGNVEDSRDDLDKAEGYYRRALEIMKALSPGSLDVAAILSNLGNVEIGRGNLPKAEKYDLEALEIQERLRKGSLDVADTLNNLGMIAEQYKDLSKAENYYLQALAIYRKINSGSRETAIALNGLGTVEQDRSNLDDARADFRQSLTILDRVAPNDEADALNNLGTVADLRGDLAEAEKYFRLALALDEKIELGSTKNAEILDNLGEAVRDRGDAAQAEDLFQKALAIVIKIAPGGLDEAAILSDLEEDAQRRGDLAKTEEYCRQALDIRKKRAPESAGYAESLAALAKIMRDKQQLDEAARLYARAIDVLESQFTHLGGSSNSRAEFRAKHAQYYSAYSDLLLTQKQPELAFQVVERSRARTLLEMLAEAHVNIREGADPALLKQERNLQVALDAKSSRRVNLMGEDHSDEQVAAVSKEIDQVLRQLQQVQGKIRTSSPVYAGLTQPQPLSARQVQQKFLDADTVLVEYILGEERSFAFVVTPDSLDSYQLPKRADIEDQTHKVYKLLTARNLKPKDESPSQRVERIAKSDAEYHKAVVTLSQMILGPFASRLGDKRMLVVADGALDYVPFGALPDPSGNSPKMTPLVAKHEIVNLPSASVLSLLRQQTIGRPVPKMEVAILADPVFLGSDPRVDQAQGAAGPAAATLRARADLSTSGHSNQGQLNQSTLDTRGGMGEPGAGSVFDRLPYTRREANAILSLAYPGKGMKALDFAANRKTALSNNLSHYRFVHFATHGQLDNERPELSGLVLSLVDRKGKRQEGFLDLEDVYNLKLPVDLVVLSACETGLGKQINGEGIVGLTRGFMYAGASRVVASIWAVNDVATADLMGLFYRGMLKQGLPPAKALRLAQLKMLKQWPEPYYWAAFQIQGEWK